MLYICILKQITMSYYSKNWKELNEQIMNLSREAMVYIRAILELRGSNYELIDPVEYENEISDEVSKLPSMVEFSTVDGPGNEFAIITIDIDEKKNLTFNGIELNGSDNEIKFSENEMTSDVLCGIADLVYGLENYVMIYPVEK